MLLASRSSVLQFNREVGANINGVRLSPLSVKGNAESESVEFCVLKDRGGEAQDKLEDAALEDGGEIERA